jgi:phosphoglycolate phosphatase-like HAD superfamily hydrolase
VQKLNTTGTVTPDELLSLGGYPDFIYRPELADSPRLARYLPGTDIEVVEAWDNSRPLLHAVFDHDGTLSTQRQGWEKIMEPMMLKAIFGEKIKSVSPEVYARVEADTRDFIDKTTGIQTLAQMKGLAALVREYGFVPEEEILDEHGYKAIYNEALLEMVRERIAKMKRGELSPQDFAVKGAHTFLETLHAAGVKLYLASGTDEQDVRDEAEVMGYAHLFEGRIYGAVGDLKVEAKRVVLERILNESGAHGPELMVVGDGPVELREGRKRQARCLGIASDELCRFGLNPVKRKRLIRAGAHYVIPDFSQLPQLKEILGLGKTAITNRQPVNA